MTFVVCLSKLTAVRFAGANFRQADAERMCGFDMMPLTMAKPGETVTIRRVTGRDEVRRHLAELGFVEDGSVTVVQSIAGNLILQVKGGRIALDGRMAGRILY